MKPPDTKMNYNWDKKRGLSVWISSQVLMMKITSYWQIMLQFFVRNQQRGISSRSRQITRLMGSCWRRSFRILIKQIIMILMECSASFDCEWDNVKIIARAITVPSLWLNLYLYTGFLDINGPNLKVLKYSTWIYIWVVISWQEPWIGAVASLKLRPI